MALDLTAFAKDLVYQRSAPVDAILEDIDSLRTFDAFEERTVTRWKAAGRLAKWVMFGFGLLGLFTGHRYFEYPWVGAGLSLLALIALSIRVYKASRTDLENRRYELVHEMLGLLRADLANDAEIAVEIDFRQAETMEVRNTCQTSRGWTMMEYAEPWLTLSGCLLDGSRFAFEGSERVRQYSRRTTNARGKSKSKSKEKRCALFSLEVRAKGEDGKRLKQISGNLQGALRLPDWVTVKAAGATAKGVMLKVKTAEVWEVHKEGDQPNCAKHLGAMMFLSLFQAVNLSKTIGKRARA